jgi:hypothetical protein
VAIYWGFLTKGTSMIIWRRHGWLVLVFFLIAWGLATNVIAPIYENMIGEVDLYNPQKAVTWGIALLIVAALMFGFSLLALRNEGRQVTPEEWQQFKDKQIANYRYVRLIDDAPDAEAAHRAQFEENVRSAPLPEPTKSSHFFFIPMKVMPIIFAAVGVLVLALNIPSALAR